MYSKATTESLIIHQFIWHLPFGPQGLVPVQFSPSYYVANCHNHIQPLVSQYLCKMCISTPHWGEKQAISPYFYNKTHSRQANSLDVKTNLLFSFFSTYYFFFLRGREVKSHKVRLYDKNFLSHSSIDYLPESSMKLVSLHSKGFFPSTKLNVCTCSIRPTLRAP